jgi:glycerol-3-phosphate dehydrogenase
MLRVAPHLVAPLPIVIPTYGHGRKGKGFLGTGMRIYDLLTLDRNRGIPDRARQIPSTRFLSRSEILALFPDLEPASLTGGTIFDDGQMYSPPRVVLAFVKSAVTQGAVACNYVAATQFIYDGDHVRGVKARDQLTGEEFDVRARLVLNAAGPGAEYLLEDGRFGQWQRGSFSRDACFVIKRPPRSKYALAVQGQTRDRDALLAREARHMFVVPWREYTLVGVWHRLFPGHPDTTEVEEHELDAWIREIDAIYPSLELRREDVVHANCGLVPFGESSGTDEALSFGKESRYIDHSVRHGIRGLVTLIGIRFTTCRGDAAKALDLLLRQMPDAPGPAATETTPLAGGAIDSFDALAASAQRSRPAFVPEQTLQALLHNHGTEYGSVLEIATQNPVDAALVPGSTTMLAEVTHAVREEQAVRLEDAVLRRTNLGSASHPGATALDAVATRMQELLGWSEERRHREVDAVTQTLQRHRAV